MGFEVISALDGVPNGTLFLGGFEEKNNDKPITRIPIALCINAVY